MKTFLEYIDEIKEPTDTKESLFNKIISISLEKYPDDIEDFLRTISSKDESVREIVDKIKNLNNKFKDPDIISPNTPDNNFGNEFEEN